MSNTTESTFSVKKLLDIIGKLFVILMALITVFPFIYMILASFMSYSEVIASPPKFYPETFLVSNYKEAMQQAPFARYFVNTIFVSAVTTIGILTTSVLAAFAFVKLEFKHKNLVLMLLISLLMVPYEAIVFTNYRTIARLGLLNTYTALIVPSLASVFYIFYLKEYLTSIPISYYKAAKIDGASDLEFIRKILLPLSRPALVTVGLLSFISGWNSFIWPLLVTNNKNMRLLNNGLSAFTTETGSAIQLQMAAATITIVPILILYFFFRNEIIKGVSKSGLKG